jgi:GNAT superfamily N-acetyltransferase
MPAPDIEISRATVDDLPHILAFIQELAEYERLSHEVVATPERLREDLFGERSFAEVLLARDAGRPVGFALFFPNYSTFLGRPGLYLEDLFVRPDARGRGVGRLLLQRLAAIAVERGWGRLEWRVLDWNSPAIDFYKRLGAAPLEDWTVFRMTGPALTAFAGKMPKS